MPNQTVTLKGIPQGKEDHYSNFLEDTIATKVALQFGVGLAVAALADPTKITILGSLGFLVTAFAAYSSATQHYKDAYDPPDPDYDVLANVHTPTVPQLEAIPDGVEKDLARTALEVAATIEAAGRSRDRAIGAEIAGDAEWQVRQWEAAAKWMDRAVTLQIRLAGLLYSLEKKWESVRPNGQAVLDLLRTQGLPEELKDVLVSLGWTKVYVDDLTLRLAAAAPSSFESPLRASSFTSISALLNAMIARDDLSHAMLVRVELLSEVSRDLTPEERQGLAQRRAAIELGMGVNNDPAALLAELDAFRDEVRTLTLATLNPFALTDYENFGQAATLTVLARLLEQAISVANHKPALAPIADRVLNEGEQVSFTATGFDPDEGQALTFSLDPDSPSGAHIDPNTGVFTWTPADGTASSSSSVTVRVSDNGTPSLSVTHTFTVTVINVAPTVDTGPEATLPQGGTLSRSGSFADPGLDTWTATVDYGDGGGTQPLTLNSDKTYQLSHAFAIAGTHTVTVTVTDKDGGVGTSNFTVDVTAPPPIDGPPTIRSVVINDGSAQRSMIHSLTVTFSGPVAVHPGAFELRDQSGRLIGLNVATSVVGERTVAVLNFSKAGLIPGKLPDANSIRLSFGRPNLIGGSLADGNYTLTIRGDRISDGSGRLLDGDADGLAGGNRTERFFRRFGDANGDGRVNRRDVVRFRQTLGRKAGQTGFQPFFDFRGNGLIGGGDLFQLLRRRLPTIGRRL